jgi:enhancing lycopene biosynthesis protein 2
MPKVAVVLSGCGVFDGSEIHEAVSTLIHLSRAGVAYQCFAPNIDQPAVVNHLTGKPAPGEKRNALVESARISRGKIKPLTELHARDYAAVFFPGGFGAAKNLCDFADKGADMKVLPDVERVFREFHQAGRPIGMCCIAPVIAARILGKKAGGKGCTLTLGDPSDASRAAETMGATHAAAPVTDAVTDEKNRLVTAPAYMHGSAPVHEVFDGIGEMVASTLALAGAAAHA